MSDDLAPTAGPAAASDGVRRPLRALLSVSDKAGIVDLARGLAARGVALVSSGGTARVLREAGLAVAEVAEVTGHPEILGGRVKTLHPRIHGGILARRDDPGHRGRDGGPRDRGHRPASSSTSTPSRPRSRPAPASTDTVEEIDIGGPAMIRAAAKNHAHVAVLTDPADYAAVLEELDAEGGVTPATRRRLALKAFAHTAAYDAAIAAWLAGGRRGEPAPVRVSPGALRQPLRYGENPHQRAAFYAGGRRAGGRSATGRRSSRARSSPTTTSSTPTPPGSSRPSSRTRPA